MSMKNSNDTVENRSRDLPACGTVPQHTSPNYIKIFSVTICSKFHLKITILILTLNYQKEPSRVVQNAVKLQNTQRTDRSNTSGTNLNGTRSKKLILYNRRASIRDLSGALKVSIGNCAQQGINSTVRLHPRPKFFTSNYKCQLQ